MIQRGDSRTITVFWVVTSLWIDYKPLLHAEPGLAPKNITCASDSAALIMRKKIFCFKGPLKTSSLNIIVLEVLH